MKSKYSDITLLEEADVLNEFAITAGTIAQLAGLVGGVVGAGIQVYQAIKIGKNASKELYYITDKELTASTTPTYGYKSIRVAVIAYATKMGIKDGEKNTFFVTQKQLDKANKEVYLYKFDSNMMGQAMKHASFVDICKSINVDFEIKGKRESDKKED